MSAPLALFRMEWMPSTLQLRTIMYASWSTSFRICTWKTWTSLMRYVCYGRAGPVYTSTRFFFLPTPTEAAKAASMDRPGPVPSSSITLADTNEKCWCWWWPWHLDGGGRGVLRKKPSSFVPLYSLILVGCRQYLYSECMLSFYFITLGLFGVCLTQVYVVMNHGI